jgi:hypothetical protein
MSLRMASPAAPASAPLGMLRCVTAHICSAFRDARMSLPVESISPPSAPSSMVRPSRAQMARRRLRMASVEGGWKRTSKA